MFASRFSFGQFGCVPPVATGTGSEIRFIWRRARMVLGQTIFAVMIFGSLHSVALADAVDHRRGFLGSGHMWDGTGGVMMFHWFMIFFVIGLFVYLVAGRTTDGETGKPGGFDAAREERPMEVPEQQT